MFGVDDLILGGMGLAGSLIGSSKDLEAVEKTNATNVMLARENTAFQERMANSAHQREVMDLRKAGLNPVLAAGGSGAPSPSGSVGRVEPGQPGRGVRDVAASAFQLAERDRALKATDADIKLKAAQTAESLERASNVQASTGLARSELAHADQYFSSRALGSDFGASKLGLDYRLASKSYPEALAALKSEFREQLSKERRQKTAASREADIEARERKTRQYDYWIRETMNDLGFGSSGKDAAEQARKHPGEAAMLGIGAAGLGLGALRGAKSLFMK